MSTQYAMNAEKRDRAGKGVARALRREGKVPAVIYGDNKDPVTIAISAKEINLEYLKGHIFTSVCNMEVDGKDNLVLARDVQLHPVKDTVVHVDFLRVTAKTKITVSVPVHFINEDKCPGLREKGVLNITRHEVDVVCQATSIPEYIEVDLTTFEIGDAIKSDIINLPENISFAITDRDFTIATIVAPRRIEDDAAEDAAGEEGAEAAEAEGDAEAAEGDSEGGEE